MVAPGCGLAGMALAEPLLSITAGAGLKEGVLNRRPVTATSFPFFLPLPLKKLTSYFLR